MRGEKVFGGGVDSGLFHGGFFRHRIILTVCFELIVPVGLGVIAYDNPGNLGTLIARGLRYVVFPLLGLA